MPRVLQVFGQPGAHSLYTIFAGHDFAVNNIVKRKREINWTSVYMCFFSAYDIPPPSAYNVPPTSKNSWIPFLCTVLSVPHAKRPIRDGYR